MNTSAATADMGAHAEGADEHETKSIADAIREASKVAADNAAAATNSIVAAGPGALGALSRFGYNSAYVISYGVVYVAVFVAKSLPQENPVMYGLRDGARAAADAVKAA